MNLRIGEHQLKLTAENANVVLDGVGVHVGAPVIFRGGELLLPIGLVGDVIADLVPFPAHLDAEEGVLTLGSVAEKILGLTLEKRADGWEATVLTSGAPDFREEAGPSGEILLRFGPVQVESDTLPLPPDPSLLRSWRWEVRADTALLRIEPGEALVEHRVTRRVRPEGVTIRLASVPIVDLAGEASWAIEVLTRPKATGEGGGGIVVIDPGHGGSDRGVSVPGLPPEKELTLDIAVRLRSELERGGIRALLTRESDVEMDPRARAEAANRAGGGLFISLHINGSPARGAGGPEVYVYALGRGGEERIRRVVAEAAAAYGGASLGGALSAEIRFVPWEAVQEIHRGESRAAADRVAEELFLASKGAPKPVREAPAGVLKGVDMAAVLVEVGYATSDEDRPLLASEEGRARLAGALARALGVSTEGSE